MRLRRKNCTVKGKSMSKFHFVQLIKISEKSGELDFDEAIKIMEDRLKKYRKINLPRRQGEN